MQGLESPCFRSFSRIWTGRSDSIALGLPAVCSRLSGSDRDNYLFPSHTRPFPFNEFKRMSFLHSSYSSDTSSDTSISTPARDLSLHNVDDHGQRLSPERREGSDPSTVTQMLPPTKDQAISDLADYDHQWDPDWREGSEEQHLYILK